MKRLLQRLGLWKPRQETSPPTGFLSDPDRLQRVKRMAHDHADDHADDRNRRTTALPNNGISYGDSSSYGPDANTWAEPEQPPYKHLDYSEDSFTGFGGGDSDGSGASGSWDESGSSSDSSDCESEE